MKIFFNKYIVLMLKGFCMGAADVVPGVSGGTMAFILGIYKALISSIKSFDMIFVNLLFSLKIKEAFNHTDWKFLLPLCTGILAAVFTLAKILSWLLQNTPVLIWSFFFGLIVASIITVGRRFKKWTFEVILFVFSGAATTYFIIGIVPASTPHTPFFLFLSGALAICAMILPGISGSFILVLLGKYQHILEAVSNRDIYVLFIVASGAGFGIIAFVRLVNWLFKRYHDATIALLSGLMIGSLRKVWPWKKAAKCLTDTHHMANQMHDINFIPNCWSKEVSIALCFAITGFLAVLIIDFMSKKNIHTFNMQD